MFKEIGTMMNERKIKAEDLFNTSDTDQRGCINILDLKVGMEKIFGSPSGSQDEKILRFIKEVKNVFKTADFCKETFFQFMVNPKQAQLRFG